MPSNAMRPSIRVAGVPLDTHAPVGEIKVEHRWPFGCWELQWSMALRPRQRLAGVVKGAKVECLLGGLPIWAGHLGERGDDGNFMATGAGRPAEHAPALNTSGKTTTTPDVAIDNAITNGWLDWTRPSSISNVAYAGADSSTTDASDQVNMVAALLDAYAAENDLRWAVGARRIVYVAADPTTPTWDFHPNEQVLSSAEDKLASTIVARWADSAGKLTTTSIGSGLPIAPVDLTGLGGLTLARVQTISNTILTRAAAAAGTVGSFTITRDQIRGRPHLARVIAGQRVRLLGQQDPTTGINTTPSIVLGVTSWDVAEGTVTCTPVDAAARSLSEIVAEQGGTLG